MLKFKKVLCFHAVLVFSVLSACQSGGQVQWIDQRTVSPSGSERSSGNGNLPPPEGAPSGGDQIPITDLNIQAVVVAVESGILPVDEAVDELGERLRRLSVPNPRRTEGRHSSDGDQASVVVDSTSSEGLRDSEPSSSSSSSTSSDSGIEIDIEIDEAEFRHQQEDNVRIANEIAVAFERITRANADHVVRNLIRILGAELFTVNGPENSAENGIEAEDVNQIFRHLLRLETRRHNHAMGVLTQEFGNARRDVNPAPRVAPDQEVIELPEFIDSFLIRFFSSYNTRLSEEVGFHYWSEDFLNYIEVRVKNPIYEEIYREWLTEDGVQVEEEAGRACLEERGYLGVRVPAEQAVANLPPLRRALGLGDHFDYEQQKARDLLEVRAKDALRRIAGGVLLRYGGMSGIVRQSQYFLDEWFLRNFSFPIHLSDLGADNPDELGDELGAAQGARPEGQNGAAQRVARFGDPIRLLTATYFDAWLRVPQARKPRITVCQLKGAVENGASLLAAARRAEFRHLPFSVSLRNVSEKVDILNSLFDQSPRNFAWDRVANQVAGSKIARFTQVMDEHYFKVLLPFKQWVQSNTQVPEGENPRNQEELRNVNLDRAHPLTRLYALRGFLHSGWVGPLAGQQDHRVADGQFLNQFQLSVEGFVQSAAAYAGVQMPRDLSAEERRMIQYVQAYYRVEQGRYYLEEDLARAQGIVNRKADPRIQAYWQLAGEQGEGFLAEALRVRYQERLAQLGQNLIVPLAEILAELRQFEAQGVQLVNFQNQPIVKLRPGIYESDDDVELRVRGIHFHPLSMIRTYGHNVRLIAQNSEILNPWIDTSSLDRNGNQVYFHRVMPIGIAPVSTLKVCRLVQVPEAPMFADMAIFDYGLAKDCLHIANGRERNSAEEQLAKRCVKLGGYGGKYGANEWHTCHLHTVAGTVPGTPAQTPQGRRPGNIELRSGGGDSVQLGFPLFAALGGDGAVGSLGGNSPLCDQSNPPVYRPPMDTDIHWYLRKSKRDLLVSVAEHLPNNQTRMQDFMNRSIIVPSDKLRGSFGVAKTRLPGWDDPLLRREVHNPAFDVSAGLGGLGGAGSEGGFVSVGRNTPLPVKSLFLAPGRSGAFGQPGRCGPQPAEPAREIAPAGVSGNLLFVEEVG